MKKTFLTSILSLALFLSLGALLVHAQGNPGGGIGPPSSGGTITLDNPFSGGDSLFALLESIINDILLPIGGVLAVLAFIYSGFLYVTAQGNESKLAKAHRALLYTAIGTAVLLGSWAISQVIENTINELR